MRRATPLLLAFALAVALAVRCASNPRGDPEVRVTHERSAVRECVDLAGVKSDLDDEAAEKDLKRQAGDLGGNVLLALNAHKGEAFYCATPPPPEIALPGPSLSPTPKLRP